VGFEVVVVQAVGEKMQVSRWWTTWKRFSCARKIIPL
jgi:hypothetical protein